MFSKFVALTEKIILDGCMYFDRRLEEVQVLKKWEISRHIIIKFDGFKQSLHEITVFPLILLSYSAYAGGNCTGHSKFHFSIYVTFDCDLKKSAAKAHQTSPEAYCDAAPAYSN